MWAIDITYIPMARGFVYLAVVLDWFSRRVLPWRLSFTMEAAFCVETLEDALAPFGEPERHSCSIASVRKSVNGWLSKDAAMAIPQTRKSCIEP